MFEDRIYKAVVRLVVFALILLIVNIVIKGNQFKMEEFVESLFWFVGLVIAYEVYAGIQHNRPK